MAQLHLYAAWIGITAGFLSGALLGLFFHGEEWLGGYGSWSRRMARLGHISFFGIAFINLTFALSLKAFEITLSSPWPSWLLLGGAVTMPLVCFLSAWQKRFRHFFPVPVLCLLAGTLLFLWKGVLS
jgi:hypothetical protein